MRALDEWLKSGIAIWMAAWAALHLYFGGFGFPEPIEMRSLHLLVFTPPLFFALSRVPETLAAKPPKPV